MAKHVWSVLANKSIVDKHSNNASLFDVLEQITLAGPGPKEYKKGTRISIPFNFSLTTLLVRSKIDTPEMVRLKTTLLAPDKDELYSDIKEVDLTEHRRSRVIAEFSALPIKGQGVYLYQIDLEENRKSKNVWVNVSEIPLEVVFDLTT